MCMRFGLELETLVPQQTQFDLPKHRDISDRQTGWIRTSDPSLQPSSGENGAEFVSGVYEFNTSAISWLYESTKAMKASGARVNRSCGFHLSTSTFTMTPQKFYNFVKMAKRYQQVFIGVGACPHRENGRWATPWRGDATQVDPDSISESDISDDLLEKYRWLNLRSLDYSGRNIPSNNRMELRSPTGTLNADKITAITNLWCSFYQWTQCDKLHFIENMDCNSKGIGSKKLDELLENIGYTNRGRRNRHFNFHVPHAKQSIQWTSYESNCQSMTSADKARTTKRSFNLCVV